MSQGSSLFHSNFRSKTRTLSPQVMVVSGCIKTPSCCIARYFSQCHEDICRIIRVLQMPEKQENFVPVKVGKSLLVYQVTATGLKLIARHGNLNPSLLKQYLAAFTDAEQRLKRRR